MQDEHILREYSGYKLKQQRPGYPHVFFLIVPPASVQKTSGFKLRPCQQGTIIFTVCL